MLKECKVVVEDLFCDAQERNTSTLKTKIILRHREIGKEKVTVNETPAINDIERCWDTI